MEYKTSRVFHLTIFPQKPCHFEISGQLCGNFIPLKLGVRFPEIRKIQKPWKILKFWRERKWSVPMIFLVWWLNFQVIRQDCHQNLRKLNSFRLRISHDFSITQILREINFGKWKNCHFSPFRNSEFLSFWIFALFKKLKMTKFTRTQEMAKMAFLELLNSRKLISRKIWKTEKS